SASIELVQAVALIGDDVDRAFLHDLLEADTRDALAGAIEAGVLEERDHEAFGFAHPALGELVLARIGESRADLHLRIAHALRRRGRVHDLPAIAQHLAAAGSLVPAAQLRAAAVDAGAHASRAG